MIEVLIFVLGTLLIWGALALFTAMAWWVCLILAAIVMALGVWVGPELLN